jgi:hypothetical protein
MLHLITICSNFDSKVYRTDAIHKFDRNHHNLSQFVYALVITDYYPLLDFSHWRLSKWTATHLLGVYTVDLDCRSDSEADQTCHRPPPPLRKGLK